MPLKFKKGKCIISISATLRENLVTLCITDNGQGLSESVKKGQPSGFGLELVAGLTKQLKGKMKIEGSGGTRIILEFEKSVK